jgi:hypothetical protein
MHEAQESHCGNRAVWLQQRPCEEKGFDVSKRLSDGCELARTLCALCSFLFSDSCREFNSIDALEACRKAALNEPRPQP